MAKGPKESTDQVELVNSSGVNWFRSVFFPHGAVNMNRHVQETLNQPNFRKAGRNSLPRPRATNHFRLRPSRPETTTPSPRPIPTSENPYLRPETTTSSSRSQSTFGDYYTIIHRTIQTTTPQSTCQSSVLRDKYFSNFSTFLQHVQPQTTCQASSKMSSMKQHILFVFWSVLT